MEIEVTVRHFSLTDALRWHVIRCVERAMRRHTLWVERVEVQVGDRDGSHGRTHKFCRVLVHFAGLPAMVVKDLGADLYTVVNAAAHRAGANVARRVAHRIRIKRLYGTRSNRGAFAVEG